MFCRRLVYCHWHVQEGTSSWGRWKKLLWRFVNTLSTWTWQTVAVFMAIWSLPSTALYNSSNYCNNPTKQTLWLLPFLWRLMSTSVIYPRVFSWEILEVEWVHTHVCLIPRSVDSSRGQLPLLQTLLYLSPFSFLFFWLCFSSYSTGSWTLNIFFLKKEFTGLERLLSH